MTEKEPLAAAVQELAWEIARREAADDRRMDATSPWEPGLTAEQRRQAWLATLSALDTMQAEITRLTSTAASRAAEFGADHRDIARATGTTPRTARRRWAHLSTLFGGKGKGGGPDLGTLSAQPRAVSSRLDNYLPL